MVMSIATSGDKILVTGATGLLGSHLAERLVAQGDRVRTLVRAGSSTDFLNDLGVEIVRGDLTDPAACKAAVAGVARVFHCAAKVGDWGRWCEFQTGCVDATRILARQQRVRESIASFTSARPAHMAIPPRVRLPLMSRPLWDKTFGPSITTRAARSIASARSGKWPRPGSLSP